MMKLGTIQINQTLHGYKNGHELISTSVDLPLTAKRRMLVLSDLSGTSVQKGFKEYYTGYPVKEANAYALAKSWYAPEMERPGCVWTHTLIIAYADLALINKAQDLMSKFRRPNLGESDFEEYNNPFDLFLEDTSEYINVEVPSYLVKQVISELYSQKNKAVLVADEDNSRWDKLFFYIWLQQWPKLRRSFTFCTGAISPRYFEKSLFELQVISNLARYDSLVTPNSSKIIDVNNENVQEIYPAWVEEIYNDLQRRSDLRKFLRQYGTDLLGTTTVVSSLVKAYLFFKSNLGPSLKESIIFLATNFKKKNDGNSLKLSILFNNVQNTHITVPCYKILDVLEELTTTEFFLSFDFEKLEIRKRFANIYDEDKSSFFKFVNTLINRNINRYGELLLIETAEMTKNVDVEFLIYDNKSIFFTLEGISPKHCYNDLVWKRLERHQGEYLSLLFKSHEKNSIDWKKIITIILKIRANINPENFNEKGIAIIPYVLSYLQKEDDSLEDKWSIYLKYRPQEVLSWINQNDVETSTFLHFVLSILNPNSLEVNNSDVATWTGLLLKFPDDSILSSFVMAISFHKNSRQAVELLELTFDNVYNSLYYGKLDYDTWKYLELHTQPLNFYNDWDKCKKLINAVARLWVDKNIKETAIEIITSNKELAKKLYSKIQKLRN